MTSNILLPNKQQQLLDDLKADLELQRQQMSDFDPILTPRDETPTPPADEGKSKTQNINCFSYKLFLL